MKSLFLVSGVLVTLFSVQAVSAQTDLYIESVSYRYDGPTGYLHTNICNRGTTPNKTPRAHIRIMREGVWNVTEIQNIGSLSLNRCYDMRVNYGLDRGQTYQTAVLLDPKEQLADSDRTNNYVIADFVTSRTQNTAHITPTDWIHEFAEYKTRLIQVLEHTHDHPHPHPHTAEPKIEVPTVSVFPDTSVDTLEGQAANVLQQRQIISGYPDGEFKGSRSVNRAEIAKFILLAKGIEAPSSIRNDGKFNDVGEGEWYIPYIIQARNRGILSGYPDGSFRPAQTVNTVEFLKIITNTFDLPQNLDHSYTDVSGNEWYAPYVGVAQAYDLFPERGAQLNPGQQLTRKEVAIAIYKVLEAQ